jgi:hypothetical protein
MKRLQIGEAYHTNCVCVCVCARAPAHVQMYITLCAAEDLLVIQPVNRFHTTRTLSIPSRLVSWRFWLYHHSPSVYTFPVWSLPLKLSLQNFVCVLHDCCVSFVLFGHPYSICWRTHNGSLHWVPGQPSIGHKWGVYCCLGCLQCKQLLFMVYLLAPLITRTV